MPSVSSQPLVHNWHAGTEHTDESISRVNAIFRQFDLDGDGNISYQELTSVFQSIDPTFWNPERVSRLLKSIDLDNSGLINYEELIAWIMRKDQDMSEARQAMLLMEKPCFKAGDLIFSKRDTTSDAGLWIVTLDQTDGSVCGVTINAKCVIKAISSKGNLAQWNRDNSGKKVSVGDRIIKVHSTVFDKKRQHNKVQENEVQNDAHDIVQEMKRKAVLKLTIQAREAVAFTSKVTDSYVMESTMDEGRYAVVKKAHHVKTKRLYAVKSIFKDKMPKEAFESECQHMMSIDHGNIVKLHEVFEDFNCVHLVLDLCSGGEILEAVFKNDKFSERQAARVMQQVLAGICYLHSHYICHRDVKPDNVMLEAPEEIDICKIKLIDFGSARQFKEGTSMRTLVGSYEYTACEVVRKCGYTQLCDVWSCGVVMYFLLAGYPPFVGESDSDTIRLVQSARLTFFDEDWADVSKDAIALVTEMLRPEIKRPTADSAINDKWVKELAPKSTQRSLKHTQANMQSFHKNHKLKKVALHAMAVNLTYEEIEHLREDFELIDKNGDGRITFHELTQALEKHGQGNVDEWRKMFEAIDVDGNLRIRYTEFIAAALDKRLSREEDVCWTAFNVFDRDGSGMIDKKELKQVLASNDLSETMNSRQLATCLEEIDVDGNGQVDFHEFMSMMQSSPTDRKSVV